MKLVERLILIGAMDSWGIARRQLQRKGTVINVVAKSVQALVG